MLPISSGSHPVGSLRGENLVRFIDIEKAKETIRKRVSLGGARNYSAREFRRLILPFPGVADVQEPSSTSLLSQSETYKELSEEAEEHLKQERRKAEFGYGHRDLRDERSDWLLDEPIEKRNIDKKLSRLTEFSLSPPRTTLNSVAEGNLFNEENKPIPITSAFDMRLFDNISPKDQEEIYSMICNRYGKESGRRYLLVRSMLESEKEIDPWITCDPKSAKTQTFIDKVESCLKAESKHGIDILCQDISEDVKQKMETLVNISPVCTTQRIPDRRKWKDNLKGRNDSSGNEQHMSSLVSVSSFSNSDEKSDKTLCDCALPQCDCDLNEEKCHIQKVKKKCILEKYEVDEVNNYLITCRQNLLDKKHQDRSVMVLEQHATRSAKRETRESVYLQSSHDQAHNELLNCLARVQQSRGSAVFNTGFKYVEDLANVVAEHKMINEQEWRAWRHTQSKMENADTSDGLDSLESDMDVTDSSDSGSSDCNIRSSTSLHPSRIPYFRETFDLANMLFEKIYAKMDKIVGGSDYKNKFKSMWPYTNMLKEKLTLLFSQEHNRMYRRICKMWNPEELSRKKFVTFSEKRRRKRYTAKKMRLELNRKQSRRKLVEGLQLGRKNFREKKRSFLYTEEENYRGFSPRRQRFLQKPGSEKLKKCNLVGKDLSGRSLTKKAIHRDYRFIRSLFDDQLKKDKDSLWDPGMKQRMEEYLRDFKNECETMEVEEELEEDSNDNTISFQESQKRPKKEEQKTQTAVPDGWSRYTKSSGTAAGTLTSMIRSLRRDAGIMDMSRCPDSTLGVLGPGAPSFGQSTAQSGCTERGRVKPTSRSLGHKTTRALAMGSETSQPPRLISRKSQSLALGLGRVGESRHAFSLKSHAHDEFLPSTRSSFVTSEKTKTEFPMNRVKRLTTPSTLAKSIKTLPPQKIGSSKSNNIQKTPWKYSKSIR